MTDLTKQAERAIELSENEDYKAISTETSFANTPLAESMRLLPPLAAGYLAEKARADEAVRYLKNIVGCLVTSDEYTSGVMDEIDKFLGDQIFGGPG